MLFFSLLLDDRVVKRWLYLQDSWKQRSEHTATDWPQCGAVDFSGGRAKHCSIVQREGVNSALALAFIFKDNRSEIDFTVGECVQGGVFVFWGG